MATAYTGKAKDYAAYRLPYAAAGVEALCASVGLESSWVVADIGSGTGNLARHLVGRARRVFAVEPDDAMRHFAEDAMGSRAGFVSVAGTAEATTLPDRSVDLISVGQALHWFDVERAYREFDRILKSDGWLAVLWNRFGMEAGPDVSVFLRPGDLVRLSFPMIVQEDWERFIGGARSAAGAPNLGDPRYDEFARAQRASFDRQARNGLVDVRFTTELAVGRMHRGTTGSWRRGETRA